MYDCVKQTRMSLFLSHTLLSKIEKKFINFPVLFGLVCSDLLSLGLVWTFMPQSLKGTEGNKHGWMTFQLDFH